jgi:hypothetical protein
MNRTATLRNTTRGYEKLFALLRQSPEFPERGRVSPDATFNKKDWRNVMVINLLN